MHIIQRGSGGEDVMIVNGKRRSCMRNYDWEAQRGYILDQNISHVRRVSLRAQKK